MRKSMLAWIRKGSIILLTMLLFLTAAVAENAQIPILIDGVRVAFFDADGNLPRPKRKMACSMCRCRRFAKTWA